MRRKSISEDGKSKRCSRCKTWKPLAAFNVDTNHWSGLSHRCRDCAKGEAKKKTPQYNRNQRLKRMGMTPEDYSALLDKQGGKCAICRSTNPGQHEFFARDHNHSSGATRGLLCTECNLGLGKFKDDPAVLRRAADYLEGSGLLTYLDGEHFDLLTTRGQVDFFKRSLELITPAPLDQESL